jgi:gluconolactonase
MSGVFLSRRSVLAGALSLPLHSQQPILRGLEPLGEFGVHEGPAWHPELGVLCTGNGKIFRYSKDGKVSVYRDPAGRPNGLLVDAQGRLIVCEQGERRVTRTEKDGSITVLADRFEGARFHSPNDLTIDSKGRIYFSDPRYGPREGMELKDSSGRLVEGVYRIDAPGVVHRVIAHEADRPNGVLVSPKDEFLYVADNNNSAGGARKLWRFRLRPDGGVDAASRKLIFDWGSARGPDGLKMDRAGRLFVAAGLNKPHPPHESADKLKGGIYVLSPEGKLLQFLAVPLDEVTNCAFGGADGKSLFITAGGGLFRSKAIDAGWIPGRFA